MHQPPAHSWLEISRRALVQNISAHRRLLSKNTKLMAVVKSNAYGHGMVLVAKVCQKSRQVDWLGVASLNEAMTLRIKGINLPILVLSYYHPLIIKDLAWAIKKNISFIVYERAQILALERAARLAGGKARVHLKLETGMARLGLFAREAAKFVDYILNSKYLVLQGIASHFATAEDKNQAFLNKQIKEYYRFLKLVDGRLPKNLLRHIACSAAITSAPQSHLNLVRLGIALYGLWPSLENKQIVSKKHPQFKLQPALTWKTQIVEIQKLAKGVPVGYARTYITKRPTTMAVIPVGYWEGYDRKLSNRGEVLIHGKKCPVIGRICMNISIVDISAVKNVRVGDEVVLIGKQGQEEITVDDLAKKIGTINYEVVTRINPQLPRILIK